MRVIRIYQAGHYCIGDTVALSSSAVQHVALVLRMQPEETVTLFCGDNREYSAIITSVQKKKVTVVITAIDEVNRESPQAIHLAQALSKGDKMEWVIQKAVELGVTSITPLITSRCVVRMDQERLLKKQQQWQAIAIAACEQSGRNQLPMIQSVCLYESYLKRCVSSVKLVLHPHATGAWREVVQKRGDIALIVGPEGGLSDEEVTVAQAHGFESLCLGPRVLRTETAAVVALGVIQAVVGDL